jgi:alpha-N-acetylglucosaminidase
MRLSSVLGLLALCFTATATPSTQGLYDLVKRRLPSHCDAFVFTLANSTTPTNSTELELDEYTISTATNGSIAIEGNSLSALATGLRKYFTDVAHVDVYWFIGSRLEEAASPLPKPNGTLAGKSIVPWRYYFNTGMQKTVSFSFSLFLHRI